ncbi:MAG: hypothetical protein ACWGQW_23510, partial [bacterium]
MAVLLTITTGTPPAERDDPTAPVIVVDGDNLTDLTAIVTHFIESQNDPGVEALTPLLRLKLWARTHWQENIKRFRDQEASATIPEP